MPQKKQTAWAHVRPRKPWIKLDANEWPAVEKPSTKKQQPIRSAPPVLPPRSVLAARDRAAADDHALSDDDLPDDLAPELPARGRRK
eukprot:11437365-Alexandrium_andersonii.AAC.1